MQSKPEDYWAWYQKGLILQELNQWLEAISCYEKALETEPEDEIAWYQKALCHLQLNEIEDSLICILKAIDGYPEKYIALVKENPVFNELKDDPRLRSKIDH